MDPRIVPRKEHRISRKQISPNAVKTLYRLYRSGFVAYLVGGCVRDLLLGRSPKDFDIATNARPGQIKKLFRNCRLVGRRFRLAHLHFQDEILEVSTFRSTAMAVDNDETGEAGPDASKQRRPWHMKDEDGMILVDNVFGTPEEDALRRDFTINALAYNIADFSVIDFTTGLTDLQNGIIRPIGDPRVRFTEDPVRMLRAIRFAASHGFNIEDEAWQSIRELSATICRSNASRLYEEMLKLFLLGSAGRALNILAESGLLAALFPWLSAWITSNGDGMALLEANLESYDRLKKSEVRPSIVLLLAALFGPGLQEMALTLNRAGVPHRRALDQVFADCMKEICRTVTVPIKISSRIMAILDLQASLTRMPKRRPGSVINRPEFPEALAYLRLSAERRTELQPSVDWWDDFLLHGPPVKNNEPNEEQDLPKKRRTRRYKRRRPKSTA